MGGVGVAVGGAGEGVAVGGEDVDVAVTGTGVDVEVIGVGVVGKPAVVDPSQPAILAIRTQKAFAI